MAADHGHAIFKHEIYEIAWLCGFCPLKLNLMARMARLHFQPKRLLARGGPARMPAMNAFDPTSIVCDEQTVKARRVVRRNGIVIVVETQCGFRVPRLMRAAVVAAKKLVAEWELIGIFENAMDCLKIGEGHAIRIGRDRQVAVKRIRQQAHVGRPAGQRGRRTGNRPATTLTGRESHLSQLRLNTGLEVIKPCLQVRRRVAVGPASPSKTYLSRA